MTNYEQFMKMLEDKGHIKALKVAINFAPLELAPEEIRPNIIRSSIGVFISSLLNSDAEIKQIFDKAACDIILDQIFKDLDLKKDINFKTPSPELLFKSLIDALGINKEFKE